ncbi:HpcH/HpaI aldolase family protein [Acetohalobium arabaticum]|uniref:2-dehydro-3-deoxyglucarate aldolase n=1 Tax=Acetohalobium arabaticum (strain ATCC 49924 / DSM 5501 / Z-7288) TaxID=574087 RepID=D9QPN3_ACEAZ|nr:aldolase/citrate lyase family protein [Acetohalobium arabaticum]ADL12474.1 2-dehydro-3-deoxyglucarate aldolase [Acetohalobium arabaticum DSM 5501]
MIRKNEVKQKLKNGEPVVGTFVKMNDPASVEILGLAGFDFFVADNEHISRDKETMVNMIRAAEITDIAPIIRVRENSFIEVLQALDAGALGVQVPNVDTKEGIEEVIRSAKYAPEGQRGFSPGNRSAGYGTMDKQEFVKQANEDTLVVMHCETETSMNNLDEILLEDELDVVFIGPMDLSQSLGIIGQGDHPKLKESVDTIVDKVLDAGKDVGMVASNPAQAKELIDRGVNYVMISTDHGMLGSSAREFVAEMKEDE